MPIFLTFDDGPDPHWTPRVLDALAAQRAHGTFFVLAAAAARHPAIVRRALDEGHAVELHGDAHLRHTDHERAAIERDTDRALDRLAGLGVEPTLWRLPWGRAADWSAAVAAERGLAIVGWDADTHDWRGDPAAAMLDAVRPRLRDGPIVLMHDGLGPGARRAGCAETVAAIRPIAAAGRRRGLECAALVGAKATPA